MCCSDQAGFTEQVSAATIYSAGWNMPGYLPETDPELFEDPAEAKTYIREEIERIWDDTDGTPVGDECLTAHTEVHNSGDLFITSPVDGYVYWVELTS
jgi:hypothetical protein